MKSNNTRREDGQEDATMHVIPFASDSFTGPKYEARIRAHTVHLWRGQKNTY